MAVNIILHDLKFNINGMCLWWDLEMVFGIHYILFSSVLCYMAEALKLKTAFPKFPCSNCISECNLNSASHVYLCDIWKAELELMSECLITDFEILRSRTCEIPFGGAVIGGQCGSGATSGC